MDIRKKEAIEIIATRYNSGREHVKTFIDTVGAFHEDFDNQVIEYYQTCETLVPIPFAAYTKEELVKCRRDHVIDLLEILSSLIH